MSKAQKDAADQPVDIKPNRGKRPELFLICMLLAVITVAVYWQVVDFGFISMDDKPYIVESWLVNAGLRPETIIRAFSAPYEDNYIPLIWISFMLDHDLGMSFLEGNSPAVYHATNVVLHILNSILLFALLTMLTGHRWRSAFVAALFAIHPQHVESVAWIAERKDVLSTVFWLLTMIVYARYARVSSTGRYFVVVVVFALGLFSKPMLVTLPLVLMLMDFWPLERMKASDGQPGIGLGGIWRMASEKMSLFALSAAACAVTLYTQGKIGAVRGLDDYSLGVRIANALVAYVSYILKMFWPLNLTLYWHPRKTLPIWQTVACALVLMAITTLAVRFRRKYPYLLFGWLWYLITLLPVIGLVQVGWQAMADRYTYIPLIGIFVIVAWGTVDLLKSLTRIAPATRNKLLTGASVVVIAVLMGLTYKQIGYWRDDLAMYRHAAAVTPENPLAHFGLGSMLFNQGQHDEAMSEFRIALKLRPDYAGARYGLAAALSKKGQKDEAMEQLRAVLEVKPRHIGAHLNLGELLAQKGLYDEAIVHFEEVLRLKPDHELARQDLEEAKEKKQGGGWESLSIGQ